KLIQEYEDEENKEFTFNAFDASNTEESEELENTFIIIDKSSNDIFKNTNKKNYLDSEDVINEKTYNFEVGR
ncbi:15240_t:CDS:2, partial [Funneliformis mosseae]